MIAYKFITFSHNIPRIINHILTKVQLFDIKSIMADIEAYEFKNKLNTLNLIINERHPTTLFIVVDFIYT